MSEFAYLVFFLQEKLQSDCIWVNGENVLCYGTVDNDVLKWVKYELKAHYIFLH